LNDLFIACVFIGQVTVEAKLCPKLPLLERDRKVPLHIHHQFVHLLLHGWLVTVQASDVFYRMSVCPEV
jgi:hypothetical protein